MQLFKIKWENIMTIMLLATTAFVWVVYFNFATEVRMLAIATITTFIFIMSIISYKSIRAFRQDVIRMWK